MEPPPSTNATRGQGGTGHLLDWLGIANRGFATNPQHFDRSVLSVEDPLL
jgi:hypothetical protein